MKALVAIFIVSLVLAIGLAIIVVNENNKEMVYEYTFPYIVNQDEVYKCFTFPNGDVECTLVGDENVGFGRVAP